MNILKKVSSGRNRTHSLLITSKVPQSITPPGQIDILNKGTQHKLFCRLKFYPGYRVFHLSVLFQSFMFSKFCFKKKCNKTRSSVMNQSHFFKVALSPASIYGNSKYTQIIFHGNMTWSSTNDLDGFFMEAKRGVVKNCKRSFSNCLKIAIKRQNDKKIIGQMTAKFNAHFMKLSPLFSENYYSRKTQLVHSNNSFD